MFNSESKRKKFSFRFADLGITLIELLIVLLVVGTIASIAVIQLSGNGADATKKTCAQDAATLYAALNNWFLAPSGGNGSFPTPSGVSVPYVAGSSTIPNSSSTPISVSGASASGTTITYTGSGFSFAIGQRILVTGFTSSAYNTFGTVNSASAGSFQILAVSPVSPVTAVGTGSAKTIYDFAFAPYIANLSTSLTGATASGTTITYTGTGFTFTNGQLISVTGFSSSAYDIAGNIANASATSFQITASAVVSPTTAVGTGTALANDLYNLIPTYINKIPPEVTAFLLTTDPNGNPLSTPTVAVTGAQVGCTAGL
ncbi:MAG: hypothetical protein WCO08_02635 [Actinomycetes bacterium]